MTHKKEMASVKSSDRLPPGSPEELAGPPEGPVQRYDRLPTLDVLRGFALLGILLLNVQDFAGHETLWNFPVGLEKAAFVGWHKYLDYFLVTANWMLAEGKMRGMFSVLFGAGSILLIERLEQRGGKRRACVIFYRRSFLLLLFGLLHGFLIWSGDILVMYASMALIFLYPIRRLPTRWLLTLGVSVWIIGGSFGALRFMEVRKTIQADAQVRRAEAAGSAATREQMKVLSDNKKSEVAEAAEAAEIVRQEHADYFEGSRYRIKQETGFLRRAFSSLMFLEILGAMITGMGLYKAGYLTNRLPKMRYIVIACCGYAISWTLTLTGLWHVYQAHFSAVADARWMFIPYDTEVATGVFGNTAVLLLLLRSGRPKTLLAPISAVGRMAFSNYILTSLICKTVFSWGPWKLYGMLEFYQWYLVVAAIWATNLAFSSLWLIPFEFGPLEWLWRSLTYLRLQPMLRKPSMTLTGMHPSES